MLWEDDAFGYIMENWPTEITGQWEELYENGGTPSEQELRDFINAHSDREYVPNILPVAPDVSTALGITRQRFLAADNAEERQKITRDFLDKHDVEITQGLYNDLKYRNFEPAVLKAFFDQMSEADKRTYVMEQWPYDVVSQYMDDNNNLTSEKLNQLIRDAWYDIEGEMTLEKLAARTVR